jgi:hypothetical protein
MYYQVYIKPIIIIINATGCYRGLPLSTSQEKVIGISPGLGINSAKAYKKAYTFNRI